MSDTQTKDRPAGPGAGARTDRLQEFLDAPRRALWIMALPMIAVLFVSDLGLALMTKVAPQLNALNVMFPAKIGMTLVLVGLSFPVLTTVVERVVDHAMRAMAALMGG